MKRRRETGRRVFLRNECLCPVVVPSGSWPFKARNQRITGDNNKRQHRVAAEDLRELIDDDCRDNGGMDVVGFCGNMIFDYGETGGSASAARSQLRWRIPASHEEENVMVT
jgi:hypothetical protein